MNIKTSGPPLKMIPLVKVELEGGSGSIDYDYNDAIAEEAHERRQDERYYDRYAQIRTPKG